MHQPMWIVRPALTVVSAGLLLLVPTAYAQEPPRSVLHLSTETCGPPHPTEVTLTCDPAGGTHPRAEAACAALERAHGRFEELPSTDGPCTMEYRPTLATATGHWLGEPVEYRETFDNPCLAARESGGVLDF